MKKLYLRGVQIISITALLIISIFIVSMKKTSFISPRDTIIKLKGAGDFEAGRFLGTSYNHTNASLELISKSGDYLRKGQYISPVFSPGFPIREMIPSWNIYCPEGCGYIVEMRAAKDNESWSPWLYFGKWGTVQRQKKGATKNSLGSVKIDYFVSDRGVWAVQLRLQFYSSKKEMTPQLSLLCLAFSDQRGDLNKPLRTIPSASTPSSLWNKQLNVPYRSQGAEDSSIAGDICSPTSISMVMEYWGVIRPTAEIARLIYDPDFKLYGIWWRGVQGAAQYGLTGWVQYFRNWESVKEWIGINQPVIACISFDSGKLDGSMTPQSEGHVIVIIGFDEKGNPICNDPAGKDENEGVVVYDAEQFASAWFDKGGVGYIITRK